MSAAVSPSQRPVAATDVAHAAGRRRARMSPGRWLLAYLLALVAATLVHLPALLGGAAVLAWGCSGRARWRLLRRTLWTVLAFNLSVSLGLVVVSLWQGRPVVDTLLLVNARVLLMVFLGHWFVSRVNLLQALAGWPTLALVATLAAGQATVFARTLRDFRLAFRSRNPVPARRVDQGRHAAAQVAHLLDKAQASATESAQAMRSRGCFDD